MPATETSSAHQKGAQTLSRSWISTLQETQDLQTNPDNTTSTLNLTVHQGNCKIDFDAFITSMACCDLDLHLQNLIWSSVEASGYYLYVSSRLFKVFTRYRANYLSGWMDNQTNWRTNEETDCLKTQSHCWHCWMAIA